MEIVKLIFGLILFVIGAFLTLCPFLAVFYFFIYEPFIKPYTKHKNEPDIGDGPSGY